MKLKQIFYCNLFQSKFLNTILFFIFLGFNIHSYAQIWQEKDESENYTARHEFGFTQVGDKFIMFGGRESPQVLNVYDYTTNSWTYGGMAPVAFNHFQAVTYEGLIWVIGAFKTNTPNPELSAEYVYMYNPASQQWIQGMEIPESRKRGAAGLVVYNDKFYIVGGNNLGHSGGFVSYFDEFDPITGSYTQLSDAPHARDHFHAVVHDNKLYAVGGRLSGGPGGIFEPQVPEVDVYDFSTNTWSTLASSSNITTPRAGAATVVFQNEIYVIGGETTFGNPNGNNGQRDIVEAFNPATGNWTTKDNLNYSRHGIQAIVSGNGIYIAGGSEGGSSMKNMEYYNEDNPVGSPNINSVFLPDETTKTFEYSEEEGSVNIPITLSNTMGTTGTYIDAITISGLNYTLDAAYTNLFLGANKDLIIGVTLNNTTQNESNATVEVTYNNNATLTISLEGTLDTSLSIDKNKNFNGLKIYPNPTNNFFSLNKRTTELIFYTINGKEVKRFQGEFRAKHPFNISNLQQGVYFLKVKNASNETQTLKVIIL